MIYLDNAATTLHKLPQVGQAVLEALNGRLGSDGRGGHGAALAASRAVYFAREKLARLLGVSQPERIAFTANATEGLNLAVNGLLEPGDHAITTAASHNSLLRPLYLQEGAGVELTVLPLDCRGNLDFELLEKSIRTNTKGVFLSHGSNLTGNLTDLAAVGEIVHEGGSLLIVDGAQTAGCIPLRLEDWGVDVFCFTGHKGLMGPQGTGGIWVRSGLELPPLKVGGSGVRSFDRIHPSQMPTALEAGTLNCHGIAGLSAALDYIEAVGVENIRKKEAALARRFAAGAAKLPGITLYGDLTAEERCAIVTLNVGEIDSAEVCDLLWENYGICTRGGAHCAPLMHESLGTVEQGAVRFSFGWFNTEEEVDAALSALRDLTR